MGRNKALDKVKKKHKKGLWSPDEDQKLRNYVLEHGHGCWTSVPINAGLQRNGKSCRLRWLNYLRPGLKRGVFSREEEEIILNLHAEYGNKWCQIAHKLPGRTDNEIKNYWHSHLKKKVAKMAEAKEYSSSSTWQKSSFETLEHMEEPVMADSDQFCAPKSNLPRLLFAEWLIFDDQFGFDYGGSSSGVRENASQNDVASNSQHGFNMHDDLLLNEGTNYSGELMLPKLNNSAGDGDRDVFQQEFDFETLYSQSEFGQYFPSEFNV